MNETMRRTVKWGKKKLHLFLLILDCIFICINTECKCYFEISLRKDKLFTFSCLSTKEKGRTKKKKQQQISLICHANAAK